MKQQSIKVNVIKSNAIPYLASTFLKLHNDLIKLRLEFTPV